MRERCRGKALNQLSNNNGKYLSQRSRTRCPVLHGTGEYSPSSGGVPRVNNDDAATGDPAAGNDPIPTMYELRQHNSETNDEQITNTMFPLRRWRWFDGSEQS